mmetsp:Transcript_79360/g.202103  ORF Transcript_79360/g.202103 Transcript_79360/m.202103 type:complete len:274 (+) Transcript_79360:51-872(+)
MALSCGCRVFRRRSQNWALAGEHALGSSQTHAVASITGVTALAARRLASGPEGTNGVRSRPAENAKKKTSRAERAQVQSALPGEGISNSLASSSFNPRGEDLPFSASMTPSSVSMYALTWSTLTLRLLPHQSHRASTFFPSSKILNTSSLPNIITDLNSLSSEHVHLHLTFSSRQNSPASSLMRCRQMASSEGMPSGLSMLEKDAMLASRRLTDTSSQPGNNVTSQPSAFLTQPASLSHSTLRPMDAGVCSLSARYCTMSSAISPLLSCVVPV